jgi:LysM repeat protein
MRAKLTVIMTLVLLAALLTAGVGQAAPGKLGATHVVQWGENLASIALRYGTTVAALCQANGLPNPNMIYIGQRLVVPSVGGRAPLPAGGGAYTVRFGDTLTNIAFRHNTSVQALMEINNLPGGFIFAGQQLIIPGTQMPVGPGPRQKGPAQKGPAMAGLPFEIVRPGDTLSELAFRYGTTVNDIMQANGLYNPWIFSGQKLVLPGRAGGPQGPTFQQPAGTTHIVSVGETLAGLALRYGTTVPAILQANELSQSNFIFPGQRLVMPGLIRSNPLQEGPGMTLPGPMNAPANQSGIPLAPGMTAENTAPFVGGAPGSANAGLQIGPAEPPAFARQQPGAPLVQGYNPVGPIGPQGPSLQGLDRPPLLGFGDQGPVVVVGGPNPVQPPAITMKWVGHLVSMTQPEGDRYPGVLRVQAGGAAGLQITVSKKPGSWSTTGFTGGKPEYGNGTAEFAPIGSGPHNICLDGQNACIRVNIQPNALTYVQFDQVPNDSAQ